MLLILNGNNIGLFHCRYLPSIIYLPHSCMFTSLTYVCSVSFSFRKPNLHFYFLSLSQSYKILFGPRIFPAAVRPNGSYLNLQIWSDKKILEPVLWFFDDKPLYKFKYKFQKCKFMKKILTAPHPLSTSYSISSYLKSREHSLPL